LPEGDSVANDAARLRPILESQVVTTVDGTSGSVRSNVHRIRGSTVNTIRTHGKNLLVDFDSGYSLHVHLEMNGRWRVFGPTQSVGGPAKVVIGSSEGKAACYSAPLVKIGRTPQLDLELRRLGPDLLGDWSVDKVIARARHFEADALARVLLNQRVAAGIGNVYKSELAFLSGIHPETPLEFVTDEELGEIYTIASDLLHKNVGKGERNTTGERGRGRALWVYGHAGETCRRCLTRISQDRIDDRVTYWCGTCQPTREVV
jgi:endonuclease-8